MIIPLTSVLWEPRLPRGQTDRQEDVWMDRNVTKLILAFRNFVKALKNGRKIRLFASNSVFTNLVLVTGFRQN
jgi:hypothetical protein